MKCISNKWIIWLINIIIFIGTIECSARVVDCIKWGADFISNYSSDDLVVTDQLGTHCKFNARFEKWKINRYGFRGPDINLDKVNGVSRVIFLGASETFGLYESENMEFPAQVRLMLENTCHGRYQILNAAAPGLSPPRASQFYQLWLSKFKPDIVVYYPSPVIYLDETAPVPAKITSRKDNNGHFQLRFIGNLRNTIKQHTPDVVQKYVRQFSINHTIGKHPLGWVWIKPPVDRLVLFKSHLTEFVIEVLKSGAKPVLMTHANRFAQKTTASDKYLMTSWRKFYPRATEECLVQNESEANNIIREVGLIYNVPIIDLEKIVPKDSKYFADYAHFNDKGANYVAVEVSNAIIRLSQPKTANYKNINLSD